MRWQYISSEFYIISAQFTHFINNFYTDRSRLVDLPAEAVSQYVQDVTNIAIHGLSALFVSADPSVVSTQGNNAPGADILHRACVSFLVSLSPSYQDIVRRDCVQRLLEAVQSPAHDAEVDTRVLPLLSVLAAGGSNLPVIVSALSRSASDSLYAGTNYCPCLSYSALGL